MSDLWWILENIEVYLIIPKSAIFDLKYQLSGKHCLVNSFFVIEMICTSIYSKKELLSSKAQTHKSVSLATAAMVKYLQLQNRIIFDFFDTLL